MRRATAPGSCSPLALLIASWVALVPSDAAALARRVAVVVGNNLGGPGKVELRYAERDAQRVGELFGSLGGVDDVRVLLGEDSTRLREAIDQIATEAKSRGEEPPVVLFFYSGHADDHALLMGPTRFPFAELRQRLNELPARVAIAFVDACQSGRLARRKGGRAVPVLDVRFEDNKSYRGRVFITSSAANELSQETDELEASYFTHYLVSALRGAADASGDRLVSLDEAYQYVYRNTLARTADTLTGPQHPTYDVDMTGQGELFLTRLTPDNSFLALPKSVAGRYLVRGALTRQLVAEVTKFAGQSVRIAVAPGEYEVTRVDDDALYTRRVVAKPQAELTIDETGYVRRELAQSTSKGSSVELVSVAYGFATPYLVDADLLHGARLAWERERGPWALGVVVGLARDVYRREDTRDVTATEAELSGRLALRWGITHAVGLATSVDAGAAWVTQTSELAGVSERSRSSAVFVARARGGVELALSAALVGVYGHVGERVYRADDGLAAGTVGGAELAMAWRF